MDSLETFNQYRPLLFSIAYRMLGSVMDAEDIVQDTFLRWQSAPETEIESPKAYLSAVVTRLSIDQLRLARTQREAYIGSWLPEPLLIEDTSSPAEDAEFADSLSIAFLAVLEGLSPVERAVFLLREVFDYDYAEIARIVKKSEPNCRQLVRRARQSIARQRPRFKTSPEQYQRLMGRFMQACLEGDLNGLVALLTEDAVSWSDGGGKAQAGIRPIVTADHVARYILGIQKKLPPDVTMRLRTVNGQPGIIGVRSGQLYSVLTLDAAGDRIRGVYIIVNPDKLRFAPNLAR